MTFATRAELVTEIEARLRRPDQTARTGGFIKLAESAMNRLIRARRKILRSTATLSTEFAAVPTDFGGARTFKLTGGDQTELRFISPEVMALTKDGQATTTTGAPEAFTVIGDEFEFYPVPAASYAARLSYYQKLDPLVLDADTNWVLADHPDVYLAGALWQGFAHLKNVDGAAAWKSVFEAGIDDINAASIAESMGGVLNPSPSMQVV